MAGVLGSGNLGTRRVKLRDYEDNLLNNTDGQHQHRPVDDQKQIGIIEKWVKSCFRFFRDVVRALAAIC